MVHVTQPKFSFVRFDDLDVHETCHPAGVEFCFPVFDQNDIAFQFIVETDTEAQADELCDLAHAKIKVGIIDPNGGSPGFEVNWLVNYTGAPFLNKPERFRIGPKKVLYNWDAGVPSFEDYREVGQCFQFVVQVIFSFTTLTAVSNCFQRIAEDCYTSILEYGSDKNAFDFIYCGTFEDETDSGSGSNECAATIVPFSNQSILNIPYTPTMFDQYGELPTVEVYIYNVGTGKFDYTIVSKTLDAVPPTMITVDMGGPGSGYVKIY